MTLIVDDEPEILESIALSLEVDYDVLTATSGDEGLKLLADHEVALVISDQRMPKMRGDQFLREVRERSPDSVRMMLTGFADFDAIVLAINEGHVYQYISKPWEPVDLELDVKRAVEHYDTQHSLGRRMMELKALCEIGATITSVLDSKLVVQKILDGVVGALGFHRTFLMIVDEATNRLKTSGSAGIEGDALDYLQQLEYDLDRRDVGVVLTVRENRPILVEDVDSPPVQIDQEAAQRGGLRSFVTAPLRAGDRPIGVLVADRSGAGERVTEHDQRLLVGFADQAAIALENARLYEEAVEKQRLEEEVGVAARIQQGLLPTVLPEIEQFEISAVSRPSRGVSGDYYDVIELEDGRIWIALGDVSGKGVPASITMATLRALFLSQIDRDRSLGDMMHRLGEGLFAATTPEVFATFYFGLLDPAKGTFNYVNAGHEFPVFARANGETEWIQGGGIPIGMDPGLSPGPYEEHLVSLSSGDTLVIYSDGVPEAGATREDMFGEERLERLVTEHRADGADAVKDAVCRAVDEFMDGDAMDDDLTMVVLAAK